MLPLSVGYTLKPCWKYYHGVFLLKHINFLIEEKPVQICFDFTILLKMTSKTVEMLIVYRYVCL